MYRVKSIERHGGQFIVKVHGEGDEAGLEESYPVAKEFFAPLGISEGDLLDDEGLGSLSSASDVTAAVSKALDVLSYSNVSRRALTEKLRYKYKIGKEEAEVAADYVVRRGFLDEASQASRIAESAVRNKLWGPRRIASELYAKGYPKEIAEDAARDIPEDSYGKALDKLISKKAKTAPQDGAGYNKLISSLIRLGHNPSAIKEALAEHFGEQD